MQYGGTVDHVGVWVRRTRFVAQTGGSVERIRAMVQTSSMGERCWFMMLTDGWAGRSMVLGLLRVYGVGRGR